MNKREIVRTINRVLREYADEWYDRPWKRDDAISTAKLDKIIRNIDPGLQCRKLGCTPCFPVTKAMILWPERKHK